MIIARLHMPVVLALAFAVFNSSVADISIYISKPPAGAPVSERSSRFVGAEAIHPEPGVSGIEQQSRGSSCGTRTASRRYKRSVSAQSLRQTRLKRPSD